MQELIERLEKATGPDRVLDFDIWAAVDQPLSDDARPQLYTASIDVALTLVPDGHASAVGTMAFKNPGKLPWACYWTPQGEPHSYEGATPAIALCIAALRARAALDNGLPTADDVRGILRNP